MDVKLATCAEHVIVDAESNRLSIVNMFEVIEAASFPLLLTNFTFVLVTERGKDEPSEQAFDLKFFLDDDLMKDGPLLIDYEETIINRSVIALRGLIIPHPGRFFAKVFEGENEVACWSFRIDQSDVEMEVNSQAE